MATTCDLATSCAPTSLPEVGAGGDARRCKVRDFEREALPLRGFLFRFALRLTGSRWSAEDLVQETFLKAWCSWHSYTPGSNARAWLSTILRHKFINQRQKHCEVTGFDATVLDQMSIVPLDTEPDGEFAALWAEVDAELRRAIEALPPAFRDALVLRDLHNFSMERIAQATDVPLGTAKSRLFRARRILRRRLYRYAARRGYLRNRIIRRTARTGTRCERRLSARFIPVPGIGA